MKKIIFQVSGGIGKSVAATAVCKAIKKQYPKSELIVFTGYTDVFTNNPNVSRCYNPGNLQYFYTDHIQNKDVLYMLQEPYMAPDFINRKGHLVKVWCEMYGVPYNGELPEIFLTHKEKSEVKSVVQQAKPVLTIQTSGGTPNQTDKYSWARDMPPGTAQKVVDALHDKYYIAHIRRQDQLPLQHAYPATHDFRPLAALIAMSEKRLFIDSFAQHTAAALGLPSVVLWIANIPEQFGYEMHHNIIANPPTVETDLKNSVFSKYNIFDKPSDFPYRSEDEIVSAETLISAVLEGKGNKKENAKDK